MYDLDSNTYHVCVINIVKFARARFRLNTMDQVSSLFAYFLWVRTNRHVACIKHNAGALSVKGQF